MAGNNLPPGTTASDIDKHFGAPDILDDSVATINIVVSVDCTGYDEDTTKDDALEKVSRIDSLNGIEVIDSEIDDLIAV